ncbi:MAG: lipopolysaccharide transport periplasmic protein LptA [Pseudomonas sp.]
MRRFRILCLAVLASVAPAIAAQSDDASQPIRIQANAATLDDNKNLAVYTGNVIITQGSMRLTGSRVTLTLDNSGEVQKLVSTGSPATFRQTPAGGKQVDARAQTIEYHADTERVILIDEAFLEQAGNTFQGQRVNYDIQRQIVDAGRATAAEGEPVERIEIVIQPRKRTEPATNDDET